MKTPTQASPRRRSVSDRSLSVWSVCVARPSLVIHLSPSAVRPCPSVCPSVRPLFVCLSVCLSVRPSVRLSVCLSVLRLDILYSAGSLAIRLHLISWSASAVVPPASVSLEATPLSWAPSLQSLVQCGRHRSGWQRRRLRVVGLSRPPPPRPEVVLPTACSSAGFRRLTGLPRFVSSLRRPLTAACVLSVTWGCASLGLDDFSPHQHVLVKSECMNTYCVSSAPPPPPTTVMPWLRLQYCIVSGHVSL